MNKKLSYRVALLLCLVVKKSESADAPGRGPFGDTILTQPVLGAARAQSAEGWKVGKLCEIGAEHNNTNATAVLQAAIDDCGDREEGGTVLVRNRTVLRSASLWLRSNLTVRVEAGSALVGTATGYGNKTSGKNVNCTDAPMVYTRRECVMMDAHAGFLNGGRCVSRRRTTGGDECASWTTLENVVLEGGGVLDANAEAWFDESDPAFESRTRPMMLDLLWIRGLTVRDVAIRRPGFWTVHPCFCDNVVIQNNSIVTRGANTDGLDPDSSWNVYVADNVFDNGDDCIAIKSGRDASGRAVNISTRNVLAERNTYRAGHGVSIGSETSAWVLDVVVRDSVLHGTQRAVRIKSARGRGGGARNVTYSNLTGTVLDAVSLTLHYGPEQPETNNSATPEIHDVLVKDLDLTTDLALTSSEPNYLECLGLDDSPITGVVFDNVRVDSGRRFLQSHCEFCSGTADDASQPQPCFIDDDARTPLRTPAPLLPQQQNDDGEHVVSSLS